MMGPELGDRIRLFRESRGLNQTQFSRMVGLERNTISRVERGAESVRHTTTDTIKSFFAYLDGGHD